jgi:hypothetical protein
MNMLKFKPLTVGGTAMLAAAVLSACSGNSLTATPSADGSATPETASAGGNEQWPG